MTQHSQLMATDIQQYLKAHEKKDMLRLLTCGSVDDGKSTLIGRLLYDSKMIFEDQMSAIESDSRRFNTTDDAFDLSLLVDGLQSEREQGITIDVAYRYFTTEQRKFIIADTPGHEQYTRNMATGASNCELAIILIDARKGIQVQTRRHSFICSLLGIKSVIVAVNKMDLIDYNQEQYKQIKADYREFAKKLDLVDVRFVPISALRGDNVVNESSHMPWYPGSSLIRLLNSAKVNQGKYPLFRFPVQYVTRPNLDFRGFSGTITGGEIRVGDTVQTLPSRSTSRVKSIVTFDGELQQASQGMAVTLTLEDEIDISRGDYLVRPHEKPCSSQHFVADIVWMSDDAMHLDREYFLKTACKTLTGFISAINFKVDVNTLEKQESNSLQLNEIGECVVSTSERMHFDLYRENRKMGSFIIIDRISNATVGAGMIKADQKADVRSKPVVSEFEKELHALVKKHFPHWGLKDLF